MATEESVRVRFFASHEGSWSTGSLADYLEDVGVVVSAAQALSAELESDGEVFSSSEWQAFLESINRGRYQSSRWRSRTAGVQIESIGVGSIDLVLLLGQAIGATGAIAIVRSIVTNGPDWIEKWALLSDRIRVQKAAKAAELREIADKLEQRQELDDSEESTLREVSWNRSGDGERQEVELAAERLRAATPDIEVFRVGDAQ